MALTDKRTLPILLLLAPAEHALHHRRGCDRAVMSTGHDEQLQDKLKLRQSLKGTKMVKCKLSWFTSAEMLKENAKQLLTQRHEEGVHTFKMWLARQEEKNLRPSRPALWKVKLTVLTDVLAPLAPSLQSRASCLQAACFPPRQETPHT